jgi:hypothetical protein
MSPEKGDPCPDRSRRLWGQTVPPCPDATRQGEIEFGKSPVHCENAPGEAAAATFRSVFPSRLESSPARGGGDRKSRLRFTGRMAWPPAGKTLPRLV